MRDKDGISAALVIAQYAARLKGEGLTLIDAREALWRKHGLVVDRQVSKRFEGANANEEMSQVVEHCRSAPPARVADIVVTAVLDLKRQTRSMGGHVEAFTELPVSDVLVFELEGGHRIMVRPSGTEPKLKFYFYASTPISTDEAIVDARQRGSELLDRIADDFIALASDC